MIGLLALLFTAVFGAGEKTGNGENLEKVDGPVIGIDLGTTYSMCSFVRDVSL